MKKFNKDKYLRKLKFKRFYRKYERYFYIGIPCLLIAILGIYFAYSKFTAIADTEVVRTTVGDFIYGDVVIKIYVNGEYSETAPEQGTGYKVDNIVCDNGAVGEWDNDDWGPTITNVTKRNKCSIYFVEEEKVKFGNTTIKLDEYGRCPSMNSDGTVTVTGAEDTYGYLCKAKDAYGDSYYFRGDVTNNYVLFGGFYWRIIRMNGDGSVRVIYDGTSAHSNGESSSDRQIGTSVFNKYWKKDNVEESTNSYIYYDNAAVGYMYGNRDGIVEQSTQYSTTYYTKTSTYYIAKEYNYNASTDKFTLKNPIAVLGSAMTTDYVGYYTFNSTSSSTSDQYINKITSVTAGSSIATVGYSYVRYGTTSKEKAQTNTNSSDIKTYIDTWYENNIKDTTNEKYIVDNIFCNDRSLSSNTPSGYSNKGYGTEKTSYRWYNFANNSNNNKIMLTCPQKNDAFTVNDTSKGNGSLTYGIGLVTTDEVVLGGGWSSSNSNYYLYTGPNYWASSPSSFYGNAAGVCYVHSNGSAYNNSYVNSTFGVRPVISLSSEVLTQGDGTMSNPFHLAS